MTNHRESWHVLNTRSSLGSNKQQGSGQELEPVGGTHMAQTITRQVEQMENNEK